MGMGTIFRKREEMGMPLFPKIPEFAVDAASEKTTRKLVFRIMDELAVSA